MALLGCGGNVSDHAINEIALQPYVAFRRSLRYCVDVASYRVMWLWIFDMRKMLRNSVVFASVLIFSTQHCSAGTGTATIAVSANILTVCVISASALLFGNYVSTAALPGQTSVGVTCTFGAPYNVGLSAGIGAGASTTVRKMTNAVFTSSTLSYTLWQDSAHTINWGQTVPTDTLPGTGNGLLQTIQVYGLIPAGQTTAATGAFADTVTATITY